jgi:hypothetical protein
LDGVRTGWCNTNPAVRHKAGVPVALGILSGFTDRFLLSGISARVLLVVTVVVRRKSE